MAHSNRRVAAKKPFRPAKAKRQPGGERFVPQLGRPTREQAEAISRTIMAAATEIFLAEGFDGTSIEAVAAKAGIPRSTLYKRFPDKTALLREVLEKRVSNWSKMNTAENWMLTDDLAQRLEQYVAWMMTWATTAEVQAFSSLAKNAWKQLPDLSKWQEVIGFTQMVELLEHDIREFGRNSGVHAKNARRVAQTLMAWIAGHLVMRTSLDPISGEEASEFARHTVGIFMRGKEAW